MSVPDRRAILAAARGVAASVLAGAIGLPAPALLVTRACAAANDGSLKAAARVGGLVFGAAGGDALFSDAAYRKLVTEQAALLTPENALKFDALQPEQGRFNFGPADGLVDGAIRSGVSAHGHCLAWNDWPAPWLKALSHAEIRRVFEAHLETVVPHFAGRLVSWDVVNEPFWLGKDHPGTFRPGPWYDAMGIDYVFTAFRRTAALDPQAKLVLNEAWTERTDPVGLAVRASLLKLIDRIQDKGLRLDAVGLQGHLTPEIPYDDASFTDFLHAIAGRGVDIYISEFDVDDRSYPSDAAVRDRDVARRAEEFLRASLSVPAVKRVVTWGLSDRYSWWRSREVMAAYGFERLPRPLPFDDRLLRKPMWHAMAESFRQRGTAGAGVIR